MQLNEAVTAAQENLTTANNVMQRIAADHAAGERISQTDAALLRRSANATVCAALEIEARLAGKPQHI